MPATAVVISMIAVAGCGSDSSGTPAGGDPKGPITVYSGQHEQTMGLLVGDFQKRTGVSVRLRSSDEAGLANQILREGSSSPADVLVAENPPALTVLQRDGRLARVPASTLGKVTSSYNAPTGDWVAVSARSAALAFNTDKLSDADLPGSLLALAGPQWKGRVGFAPTETDFQPLLTAIARLHGVAAQTSFLKALKAGGKIYDDNEALIAAVDRGEVATGIIDHYYWYRLRDEVGASKVTSALHYFGAGDAGSLVDVSGAAILRTSKHTTAAQRFLAYLVSAPAQRIIATSESYEYPLGSGVQTRKVLRALASLKPPKIGVDALGDGRAALRALQDAGLI